jgi:uroporphyrinogen decarboxylase
MRQAGRYLPGQRSLIVISPLDPTDPRSSEFRQVRKEHEFFEVCRTPELACKVTLQPIDRYAGLLDAAIIFSDILVIPQAMGLEVFMDPSPRFPAPLDTPADLERLHKTVDVHKELGYVFKAITRTRHALEGRVPLIGFTGAPWTLMAYMVEGAGSKTYQKSKTWLFKYPEESKALLMRIADVCVDYLVGQIQAGAQMVQIFESNACELSPHHFAEFALPPLVHIAKRLREKLAEAGTPAVPMSLFARGAHYPLAKIAAEAKYDIYSLEWTVDVAAMRTELGPSVAVQGNLDPAMLYAGREALEREVKFMCKAFRGDNAPRGWIANLGHGITPGVDPEDMRWFLECVHKYSKKA